jgi:hypothetical protein
MTEQNMKLCVSKEVNQNDTYEVFYKSLAGADRVVVQTVNALGALDVHCFPAKNLLNALTERNTRKNN